MSEKPLPEIRLSAQFEQQYGQQVLDFAAAVHAMARSGDSAAISETITAVAWIFAGAREIVQQRRKGC